MIDKKYFHFLFHYTPPVEIGPEPILLLLNPNGKIKKISLVELSAVKRGIITYSFSLLTEWLRKKDLPLPPNILDICLAQKLLTGRPKSDFKNKLPWDIWQMLEPYLAERNKFPGVKAALQNHLAYPKKNDFGNLRWGVAMLHALENLWKDISLNIEKQGENNRFFKVEVPAYNLMLQIQYTGICIDERKRNDFLVELDSDYVRAHHSLAIHHGLNVDRALQSTTYLGQSIGLNENDYSQFQTAAEIIHNFKKTDTKCSLLHTLTSSKRNKGILMRTFSPHSIICYPVFDNIGTVTGRILVTDPQLQFLKKKYRAVIKPRKDNQLLYVDYSQFEPSIMGNLSKDEALCDLGKHGNIYEEIAHSIFGNIQHRDKAKEFFLAYSYGMNTSGLIKIVYGVTKNQESARRKVQEEFLKMFSGVERWKQDLYENLIKDGRVGTVIGNYRYRQSSKELSSKEKRWVISQVVQGTGALILKRVILAINKLIPEAQILLPMHDALLFEVQESKFQETTDLIMTQFKNSFIEICPGIPPKTKIEAWGD